MKKTLLTLAALAMAGSAYAQGQLSFTTFNNTVSLAPALGGGLAGSQYTAGLFLAGAAADATPLVSSPFFDGLGWIQPPDNTTVVPGVGVNGTVQVEVRAWETGKTFATSTRTGSSGVFSVGPLGGPNPPNTATPPPGLDNMPAFTITPEPSTIALGALGVGALLLRRRK